MGYCALSLNPLGDGFILVACDCGAYARNAGSHSNAPTTLLDAQNAHRDGHSTHDANGYAEQQPNADTTQHGTAYRRAHDERSRGVPIAARQQI